MSLTFSFFLAPITVTIFMSTTVLKINLLKYRHAFSTYNSQPSTTNQTVYIQPRTSKMRLLWSPIYTAVYLLIMTMAVPAYPLHALSVVAIDQASHESRDIEIAQTSSSHLDTREAKISMPFEDVLEASNSEDFIPDGEEFFADDYATYGLLVVFGWMCAGVYVWMNKMGWCKVIRKNPNGDDCNDPRLPMGARYDLIPGLR